MQQAKEDLLVMAMQNGNQKAFRVIYQRYQKPLLRFAFKLCSDQELATDASQETWIKCSNSIHKLRDPRAFRSWLYKILRWKIGDLIRQKIRFDENFETLKEGINDCPQDGEPEDTSELTLAINRLPSLEKQIIHLFYLDEMKLAEVAAILEIPIGTVKSRLNRARKMLKQKFELTGR
ncbi:RNA polymerase sigma factor [Aliikangiella coralliicola]|uniref:Sigma-70 family RNA polymerase sigma factor n=1 Tax=Aliikangiella coralliicola TaxID=2592383 RepID=A0A545UFQ8_9GAMM|nr:sigma-70 family RNA polymerase sigma factor [Aliikangiella coralliicola]TQV88309.1 sigma-70 family RNA polymerase sigma factor [Aliikangiella coralliicola]